jgi:hypothetical protein
MRRILALSALAAAMFATTPAHASYTCLPDKDAENGVCVQVTECMDVCVVKPGVRLKCELGFRGEIVCRPVRLLSFEVGGL